MKQDLKSMLPEDLESIFAEKKIPKFRAAQVFEWVMKDAVNMDAMTNLSKSLREELEAEFYISRSKILEKQVSKLDGTIKYLFELEDENAIEAVFMEYKHGNALCISTQAGCRMGCSFCASGLNGLSRSLTPGEMLEEVMAVQRDTGRRVDRLVLMGTGEPFDNYENVIKFLHLINHPKGLNLGQRHITISTAGLVKEILKFAEEDLQCNLAISLHNPFNSEREGIMPITRKYPIEELLEACRTYIKKTNRRVTFEYALIRGINDTERHEKELIRVLNGMLCHINLIPVNNVVETTFEKTEENSVRRFAERLEKNGIQTTIRRELGADIDAACGQLRLKAKHSNIGG